MSEQTLVVPVQVDALALNSVVGGRDPFMSWAFDYTSLPDFGSPEVAPYTAGYTAQAEGVYLHWVVPQALRRGR